MLTTPTLTTRTLTTPTNANQYEYDHLDWKENTNIPSIPSIVTVNFIINAFYTTLYHRCSIWFDGIEGIEGMDGMDGMDDVEGIDNHGCNCSGYYCNNPTCLCRSTSSNHTNSFENTSLISKNEDMLPKTPQFPILYPIQLQYHLKSILKSMSYIMFYYSLDGGGGGGGSCSVGEGDRHEAEIQDHTHQIQTTTTTTTNINTLTTKKKKTMNIDRNKSKRVMLMKILNRKLIEMMSQLYTSIRHYKHHYKYHQKSSQSHYQQQQHGHGHEKQHPLHQQPLPLPPSESKPPQQPQQPQPLKQHEKSFVALCGNDEEACSMLEYTKTHLIHVNKPGLSYNYIPILPVAVPVEVPVAMQVEASASASASAPISASTTTTTTTTSKNHHLQLNTNYNNECDIYEQIHKIGKYKTNILLTNKEYVVGGSFTRDMLEAAWNLYSREGRCGEHGEHGDGGSKSRDKNRDKNMNKNMNNIQTIEIKKLKDLITNSHQCSWFTINSIPMNDRIRRYNSEYHSKVLSFEYPASQKSEKDHQSDKDYQRDKSRVNIDDNDNDNDNDKHRSRCNATSTSTSASQYDNSSFKQIDQEYNDLIIEYVFYCIEFYCLIWDYIVIYCRILSYFVIFCHVLSHFVTFCHILSYFSFILELFY